MPKEILLYYVIASVAFIFIASVLSKKLMKGFVETPKVKKQTRIAVGALIITSVILGITVNPYFFVLTLFIGTGLIYQAFTGFCGMSIILAKLPWNKIKIICEECRE